jgi:hypothetical protein
MCFGTFISRTFIRYLGMALYFVGGGWGTKENIKTMRIQKRGIKLITGINKYESCRQKFKENRILTVTSIFILEVSCYIKKYKGDLKHNCEIHEYNTGSKYDLHTKPRNTSLFQNSVLHMGVRLYKRLPLKIKRT